MLVNHSFVPVFDMNFCGFGAGFTDWKSPDKQIPADCPLFISPFNDVRGLNGRNKIGIETETKEPSSGLSGSVLTMAKNLYLNTT